MFLYGDWKARKKMRLPMSSNMIFLDLDGTLLSSDKSVSEENQKALKDAVRQGCRIVITTGRSLYSGLKLMEQLDLMKEGCYLLAFQGSVIYDCGKRQMLSADGIDPQTAVECMRALQEQGIHAHTFLLPRSISDDFVGEILTPDEGADFQRYRKVTQEPYRVLKDLSELYDPGNVVLPKIIAVDFADPKQLQDFQREYEKEEEGKLNSFFSCPQYLEYCALGFHKGAGLQNLCCLLGVSPEQTVAVGDERNDIPMIKAAGIGVAMANAHPKVKTVADYVTEADHDHSGVAEVIRKFLL